MLIASGITVFDSHVHQGLYLCICNHVYSLLGYSIALGGDKLAPGRRLGPLKTPESKYRKMSPTRMFLATG